MKIGDTAPGFALPDLDGNLHRLQDYRGRLVILNFWSCECPHAERTDALLMHWADSWGERVVLLPIASNTNEALLALRATAAARRFPLVLLDDQQHVADLYAAQTTPHVFVVDAEGLLRYAGAVDDVNFGKRLPERYFLHDGVEALLHDQAPAVTITQPYGCAIVRHALE